jgi:Deoxycytidine deaminase
LLRTSGTVHFYADAEGNDGGYDHGQRTQMRTFDPMGNPGSPFYRVYSGSYIIEYGEHITIPEGHVGLVKPRSRFMRSGMEITTAVWDQGYNGVGEGLLQVPQSLDCVHLPVGYPVAQLILVEADDSEPYDGSHQVKFRRSSSGRNSKTPPNRTTNKPQLQSSNNMNPRVHFDTRESHRDRINELTQEIQ